MRRLTEPTHYARIYLSGPMDVAKQIIRAECMREGLCVTIEPTDFVYTGGEEAGYVVGLVNYPRFPSFEAKVTERALALAELLLNSTHQWSAMVVTGRETIWLTARPDAPDKEGK